MKLLYTIKEAARALAISPSMLYLLMSAGDIAYVKIGRARRIHVDELQRYTTWLQGRRA